MASGSAQEVGERATGLTRALEEVYAFAESDAFKALLEELWERRGFDEQIAFVDSVIMNEAERQRRGVYVPDGMKIQKSHFADHRPTLFCVTKMLDEEPWKVTITFDSDEGRDDGYEQLDTMGGWEAVVPRTADAN